ncbi:hypothetical protein [Streptomyces prunicolor]|uniref:hypothetical protein n=1 Tax=Streptomyces prunicolor TaxID=67348 RepID=UPI0003620841|nr:hypothetical protein [Streptomyces prunicolor]
MHQDYANPEALRSFLKLCLDPGHGIKRTPVRLAEVLPEPLARKVAEFSPHVGGLRHVAQAVDEQAKAAQNRAKDAHGAYADALAAWIHDEEPKRAPLSLASCYDCHHNVNWHIKGGRCGLGECTCDQFQGERYVIGRSGVFATLYDWQEHRLVVENATEEHCRKVRDELLAADGGPCVAPDEPKPTPTQRRSIPLMEAVKVAHDAAVAHAAKCGICWPGMRFAEMCGDGRREALAVLDQVDDDTECAHIAWEVTSEYRNVRRMWVKSRKCADCGAPLDPAVEPEPHWPDKADLPQAGQ